MAHNPLMSQYADGKFQLQEILPEDCVNLVYEFLKVVYDGPASFLRKTRYKQDLGQHSERYSYQVAFRELFRNAQEYSLYLYPKSLNTACCKARKEHSTVSLI